MAYILVSSCLLGNPVRYDASHKRSHHDTLQRWVAAGKVIAVCPELAGGLPVPRPAAEIAQAAGGKAVWLRTAHVIDNHGEDVTPAFISGAEAALRLAQKFHIRIAILKEGSPSCGSSHIYDGSFRGNKIAGQGVTTTLLREAGMQVFSEDKIDEAAALLLQLEQP
ncbi:DUF523 domain-containing protein [Paenalcaligenes sp. Me131]|uniref:DUF523 domain-containing protein n=1 Tax=Paenalcaligenes sp. Me131 TaxID=3392636 RepID=UPI003D299F43